MPALTTQRNFDLKEIVPLATAQQWPKTKRPVDIYYM